MNYAEVGEEMRYLVSQSSMLVEELGRKHDVKSLRRAMMRLEFHVLSPYMQERGWRNGIGEICFKYLIRRFRTAKFREAGQNVWSDLRESAFSTSFSSGLALLSCQPDEKAKAEAVHLDQGSTLTEGDLAFIVAFARRYAAWLEGIARFLKPITLKRMMHAVKRVESLAMALFSSIEQSPTNRVGSLIDTNLTCTQHQLLSSGE